MMCFDCSDSDGRALLEWPLNVVRISFGINHSSFCWLASGRRCWRTSTCVSSCELNLFRSDPMMDGMGGKIIVFSCPQQKRRKKWDGKKEKDMNKILSKSLSLFCSLSPFAYNSKPEDLDLIHVLETINRKTWLVYDWNWGYFGYVFILPFI